MVPLDGIVQSGSITGIESRQIGALQTADVGLAVATKTQAAERADTKR